MTRRRIIWAVMLALLAASSLMQIWSGNAGDKNWLLLAAHKWLSGERLYTDIFEVNPPLIIWLYALPEWVAIHFSVSDSEVIGATGVVVSLFSAWLGMRLIRLHPAFSEETHRQWDFGLLLATVFIFFNTQIYFFDRDHLLFVLFFPYMLRFMPGLARKRPSFALKLTIAVMAALGFCIKPYTLVIFAALQLLYILRERKLHILISLENIIIYLGYALYLLCIWLFARDYLSVVMPMAMATYSGYNRRINGLLYLTVAFISAGLTFVELRPRDTTPYRRDAYYFMGVCGAFVAYALVNNGWGYIYNLLLCMILFTSGWMLWDYGWLKRRAIAEGLPARRFAFAIQGALSNLMVNASYMILCLAVFFSSASCAKYSECNINDRYLAYFKAHDVHSFSALSVNLRIWTVLARRSGAAWDTRFNHLWMLPKMMQGGDDFVASHRWIFDYVGNGLAEDLDRRKPDVVFVDANNAIFGYEHPVDIPAYFSRVPQFKEAWNHYAYATTIDNCAHENPATLQIDCRFALYSRVDRTKTGP